MSAPSKVRVEHNRNYRDRNQKPWIVYCHLCAGGNDLFPSLFALTFGGEGVKGWAKSHAIAVDFAHKHAVEHEATRCPTCLHVPAELPPNERKSAEVER